MADDSQVVVRGIDWRETFDFTQIFRAFRIAIHPSKLLLGLALLFSIYIGGRILDTLWPAKYAAVSGEVVNYQSYLKNRATTDFAEMRVDARNDQIEAYDELLRRYDIEKDATKRHEMAVDGERQGDIEKKIRDARDDSLKNAGKNRDAAFKAAGDAYDRDGKNASGDAKAAADKARETAEKRANDNYRTAVAMAYTTSGRSLEAVGAINGYGPFRMFFDYEVMQVNGVVDGVTNWNWLGEIVPSIQNFFTVGPVWLMTQHWMFFILFTIFFLLMWAIFGGAIARIAAVHVARDERISISAALKFSMQKVLSFAFAPIIPLLLVLVLGLLIWVGSLLANIPAIGPIVVGLLFFLMLIAGAAATLVLLGLAGGFNLMYPTVAVEGSDSFDAISRSFSFLYARPWRVAWYTIVSIVYGALTFLFVRFFIYLTLCLAHSFAGAAIFTTAMSGEPLWPTMWPAPTFAKLLVDVPYTSLSSAQSIGAGLLHLWIYLAVGVLGAYALSYYFSVHTIMYYLLRRHVDATPLDDVFVDQTDEGFIETAPVTAAVVTTTTVTEVITPSVVDPQPGTTPPPAVE